MPIDARPIRRPQKTGQDHDDVSHDRDQNVGTTQAGEETKIQKQSGVVTLNRRIWPSRPNVRWSGRCPYMPGDSLTMISTVLTPSPVAMAK
jgi:hypothetical protein